MPPSRRALLRTAGSALLVGLAGCSDVFTTGTPTRTVSPAPVPDPARWRTDVGPGLRARPVAGPRAVYTAVAGSDRDRTELVALDVASGSERGRQPVRGAVHGPPIPTSAGCAFATYRTEQPLGSITSLGPDGTVRWQMSPVRGDPTPLGALGELVVVGWEAIPRLDRTVVVPRGEQERVTPTSPPTPSPTETPVERTERGVVAYAVDDGRVRWRADPGDVTGGVVDGGLVLALEDYPERGLTVYDGDGERLWRRRTAATPRVADGTAYFTTDGLLAVDARTGTERWRAFRDTDVRAVAAGRRGAYVGLENGSLAALDVADGSVRWTAPVGGVSAPPTVAGETVYAVGHGVVARIDASTGEIRWRRDLGAGSATPVVVDGSVYVRLGRWLYALDATTGRERRVLVAEEGTDLTPLSVGVDGRVVVGSTDGTVYAFGGGG